MKLTKVQLEKKQNEIEKKINGIISLSKCDYEKAKKLAISVYKMEIKKMKEDFNIIEGDYIDRFCK